MEIYILLGTMWTKLCQVSITYMTLARNLYGPFELFSQLLGVIIEFLGKKRMAFFWTVVAIQD